MSVDEKEREHQLLVALVAAIAPKENSIVPSLWEEHLENPSQPLDAATGKSTEFGAGAVADMPLWASILLDVVVGVGVHLLAGKVEATVKSIMERLRAKTELLPEPRQIDEATVRAAVESVSKSVHGQS